MPIEINSSSAICSRCGKSYGRRKGYFPVSYSPSYKGIGYITICKDCIDAMYNHYLSQCSNPKNAVHQMCRKLDLYWNDKVYEMVERKNTNQTVMTSYISKLNTITYSGKSYDDTLMEEGTLWDSITPFSNNESDLKNNEGTMSAENIDDEIIAFWGPGYTYTKYQQLEDRRKYWMSRLPQNGDDIDIGTEVIIKQLCSLELDINRDRAAGKPVDKSITALNTLLGSASLKPVQKKTEDADSSIDKTPLGVWAQKLEKERPIKEVDPELRDVDGIIRYISIWFLGHLCKMLSIKNTYSKLYEEEISKRRVEHPEYEDEDDETLFNDIFGTSPANGDE